MEPPTSAPSGRRGLVDRLAVTMMIGSLMVAIAVMALILLVMNRMGDAVAGLPRAQALGSYPGRPTPVVIDGVPVVNVLVMTTAPGSGALTAVMIGHLSASKRDFTLVGLPSDLLVTASDGTRETLAESYRRDPGITTRSVEGLVHSRMDHQVHLDLGHFVTVVDALEGLGGPSDAGVRSVAGLDRVADPNERVRVTMDVVRATLGRLSQADLMTNPTRFEAVMASLTPCLMVDSDLTSAEIQATAVELQVRGDRVGALSLATTPSPDGRGRIADPEQLADLQDALGRDAVADLARG